MNNQIKEEGLTDAYLLGKYDGINQGRADCLEEIETKLVDIILGNEEFTDWQKQEISLCLECVIEQLKEQSDGQDKEE